MVQHGRRILLTNKTMRKYKLKLDIVILSRSYRLTDWPSGVSCDMYFMGVLGSIPADGTSKVLLF